MRHHLAAVRIDGRGSTLVMTNRPSSLTIERPISSGKPARAPADKGHYSQGGRAVVEHVWTATGHERPVFLDEHGRRRRWVLAGGALGGGVSVLWLGGLLAGTIGFASLPSAPAQYGHRGARQTSVSHVAHEHVVSGRDLEARTTGHSDGVAVVLRGRKPPLLERS